MLYVICYIQNYNKITNQNKNISIYNTVMERVDFIFSYWVFLWYILFYFGIINVYVFNPKFAILLGLVENIIILFLMIYYKTKLHLIVAFFIMMILLKILPIYTIWNTKIRIQDILATLVLFLIYLFWIFINKKSMLGFIQNIKNMILHNKNTLPGMILLTKLGSLVKI